jgi:hypothetical protein
VSVKTIVQAKTKAGGKLPGHITEAGGGGAGVGRDLCLQEGTVVPYQATKSHKPIGKAKQEEVHCST